MAANLTNRPRAATTVTVSTALSGVPKLVPEQPRNFAIVGSADSDRMRAFAVLTQPEQATAFTGSRPAVWAITRLRRRRDCRSRPSGNAWPPGGAGPLSVPESVAKR